MAKNPQSAIRNPQFAIALALFLIPLVYFYPVLLGKVFLAPGDGWAQNFPVRAVAGQMIAQGQLPLWNPFIFGGMPLAASVYPGSFYPPNWLFALLSAKWAMNIVVLTTYHLALIGTYLYARRIGITRTGALLAGTAFAFGGFMINHLSHTSRIAAAAWLPWVLLAIENIAGSANWRQAWRWVNLGALFIALQFFAGEPQMMVFTALAGLPCAGFAINRAPEHEDILRAVKGLAVMLVVGVSLSLIQLLPSLELLAQSERNDPGPLFFDTYSFPPRQVVALIFPYFFGGAMLPPYRVPNWGEAFPALMAGYVGLLVWLLGLVAVFGARRNGRVWLWLGVAVLAMVLAFGGYLPFDLNHLLYRIPGYKAFRGPYRHQFEFTFAMALLAGFGITRLAQLQGREKWRALWSGSVAMAIIVAAVAVLYRFGPSLAWGNQSAQATSLANPEFLVPLACFAVSVAALWLTQGLKLKPLVAGMILLCVLLLDLASYGHFFHWRTVGGNVEQRLADPPAVQLIKSREPNLNSFRVLSHPLLIADYGLHWPEDPNFEQINEPNISMMRGLQSVSGYDVLRPLRVGEITGSAGSVLNGYVQDVKSFGLEDRGLDLMNVKYLIVGYGGPTGKKVGFEHDGVYFARTNFGAELKPGVKFTTAAGNAAATEIAIVSNLANSGHLPDGAPILKLRLHARDGRVIERTLEAGRDTSEWAYDRADVTPIIQHKRARVVEDFDAGDFKSHAYLGRLKFDRAEIEKIEWIYAREDASLLMIRASLFDDTTRQSSPLANFYLPPERWHSLGKFDQAEVYENQQPLPRAWFVKQTEEQANEEILKTIRSGLMPDGRKFDPLKIALIEKGASKGVFYPPVSVDSRPFEAAAAFDALKTEDREAKAEIKHYEPQRIEIETKTPPVGGFLVLSEIDYDGWEARVDGQPEKIHRTDYTLRGVSVPAGNHRVEFVYRPRSFRLGAIGFAFGVAVLLIGRAFVRRYR